jgi:predicted phage terminase large subunit-like protein
MRGRPCGLGRAAGASRASRCSRAEKKRGSDWSCFWVIGVGKDRNYVVLDCVRDRLNLSERAATLFNLHEAYHPLAVGYEKYGMMADVQHIQAEMARRNYRFKIIELGGATPKGDRIKRLVPLLEQGHLFFPRSIHRTLYDGTMVNLIDVFVEEEYAAFPVGAHDDMLDSLARIVDPVFAEHVHFPRSEGSARRDKSHLPRFCAGLGSSDGSGVRSAGRDFSRERSGPRQSRRDEPNMSWTFRKDR